jgi:hypothetical protein
MATHHRPTGDPGASTPDGMVEPEAPRESLHELRDSLAPLGWGGWWWARDIPKDRWHFIYAACFDPLTQFFDEGALLTH